MSCHWHCDIGVFIKLNPSPKCATSTEHSSFLPVDFRQRTHWPALLHVAFSRRVAWTAVAPLPLLSKREEEYRRASSLPLLRARTEASEVGVITSPLLHVVMHRLGGGQGIPGMILAVPIIVIARIVCDHLDHPYAKTFKSLLEGQVFEVRSEASAHGFGDEFSTMVEGLYP